MAVPLTLLSVPAQTPYIQYISTTSQTVFPYPFEITQDADLVCLINGVQQNTDSGYTLSGQGATGGGNLTFTLGQTEGAIITLYRNISIARITQLAQNGTFFSANFNNEYNRIYLIMQQLEQQIANCLQIPNTNNPQLASYELTAAAYASKYLSFDSNGNPTPALLTTSGSLTAGIITGLTGSQTALETAAGATVVNTAYPVGCVDRYATNSTPGTTSMTAAFQAAVNVARKGGPDVTWGATAPYNLDNVIDCTFGTTAQQYGITFRQIGNPGVNLPTSTSAGLLVTHNKYTAFDLTGCNAFAFYDLTAVTNSSNYPQTMFLTARSVGAGGESNFGRFFNTKVQGYFSAGILYNYGSEDGTYISNVWGNFATDTGAGCVIISTNNLWQGNVAYMSSSYVTIETGSRSCIGHSFIGGDYGCNAASTTSDAFYLEGGVQQFRFTHGWVICSNSNGTTHGRSYVYNDTTNGAATDCHIQFVHGENSATVPSYGVTFGANSVTPTNWTLLDSFLPTNAYFLYLPMGVTGSAFRVAMISEASSKGLGVTSTLEDSTIDCESYVVLGTSLRNLLIVTESNVTISTTTDTITIDRGSGGVLAASLNISSTAGFYGKTPAGQTASVAAMQTSLLSTVATSAAFGAAAQGALNANTAALQEVINVLFAIGIYATH